MTSRLTRSASRSDHSGAGRALAVAWFGLSSAFATAATAAEPAAALTLRWQAPVGCPQQTEVKDRIRALTGTTRSTATTLQAEGTITQTDKSHFHLKLVMRWGDLVGERKLDASSCENLTGAAAVSLALLMRSGEPLSEGDLAGQPSVPPAPGNAGASGAGPTKPASGDGAATPSGEPAPATPKSSTSATAVVAGKNKQTPTEPKRAAEDESDPGPSEIIERPIRSTPSQWHALAEIPVAVMSFGPLPKPSWGLSFAGGASFEHWRFTLGGAAWLRQRVAAEQFPDSGADVDRLTGTLRACRAGYGETFEVIPCLSVSLEHISARGTGENVTGHSEQTNWLAAGAGLQGHLTLTNYLSLLVGLDAQVQTARPVISIEGVGDVQQLGAAALIVTVGSQWTL